MKPPRDGILVDISDGVAVVTMNRPEFLNALDPRSVRDLSAAYERLDADDAVRAVVLTGTGRAFCAGVDLTRPGGAFQAPYAPDEFRASPRRPLAFQIRKPVLAAINGPAVGLGLTLALHCDIRYIADDAQWGMVQVRRGVVPDGLAHWTLTRTVGMANAAEIALTGRLFTGADALRLGVASRCLPAAEVLPATIELAREIADAVSPMAAALSKRILWAAADATVALVDDMETDAQRLLLGTPDAMEGGEAALRKRPPVWQSQVGHDWPADGRFA